MNGRIMAQQYPLQEATEEQRREEEEEEEEEEEVAPPFYLQGLRRLQFALSL